jgi:hypothetical protein
MTTKSPSTPIWDQKREDFLKVAEDAVAEYEASESISRIITVGYKFEIDDGPKIEYHRKLRIILKNQTGYPLELDSGHWIPGADGVAVYKPLASLPWQLSGKDEQRTPIHVPRDSEFRTWTGLAESVGILEVLERAGAKRTGTLRLALRIGSQALSYEIQY